MTSTEELPYGRTVQVIVDLAVGDGDNPVGSVINGPEVEPFSGWLELIRVLELLMQRTGRWTP